MSLKWRILPSLWPAPAASARVGELELLVFTQDGVPTWEVRHRADETLEGGFGLLAGGTTDSFHAAKAAALHESVVLTTTAK